MNYWPSKVIYTYLITFNMVRQNISFTNQGLSNKNNYFTLFLLWKIKVDTTEFLYWSLPLQNDKKNHKLVHTRAGWYSYYNLYFSVFQIFQVLFDVYIDVFAFALDLKKKIWIEQLLKSTCIMFTPWSALFIYF